VRHPQSLYNDVLAEALHRLRQLRSDPDFATAKALPKSKSEAFRQLRTRHGFTEAGLQKFSEHIQNSSWIGKNRPLFSSAGNNCLVAASRPITAVQKGD